MRRTLAGAVLAVLLFAAPAATAATSGRYTAEIRRTQGGMPHIKARDFGSLGFGYAYAYAEDQACRFADIMATVNAQRSRYFGPDASYGDLGGQTNNLRSDFFYQRIKDSGVVERLSRRRYPHGPGKDVRATVRGFAAGWNAYLRRTGRDNLPDPRCRGAAWVKPIRPIQLYRRYLPARPARLGRRAARCDGRRRAARRRAAGGSRQAARRQRRDGLERIRDRRRRRARRQRAAAVQHAFPVEHGHALVRAAPEDPGQADAIGAALQGVPVVNVGFNRHVAWTHTVSTARRFAAYELKLAPGDPTSYIVDGKAVPMRARTVRVGSRSHTFYETRWGPVVVRPDATLNWTADTAYALADINADNLRLTNQWAAWDRSRSVADWRRKAAADPGQSLGQLDRRRRQGQRLLRRRRCGTEPRAAVPGAMRDGQEPAAAERRRDRRARRLAQGLRAAARPRRGRARHPRPAIAPPDRAARLHVQLERLLLAAERRSAADRASRACSARSG